MLQTAIAADSRLVPSTVYHRSMGKFKSNCKFTDSIAVTSVLAASSKPRRKSRKQAASPTTPRTK